MASTASPTYDDLNPSNVGEVIIDYPEPRDPTKPRGPSDRQALAHATEVDELLYGGAAGGGKTDYLIAETLAVLMEFPGAGAAIFRRTYGELIDTSGVINRLLDLIPQPDVGIYNHGNHAWRFRNGSTLRLCYCQRDADVTKYQGAQWAVLAIDQVEQFTEFQVRYLLHRLRQGGRVARAMDAAGYKPKAILSANPGGVGHGWVKRRYIDPFPMGGQPFRPAPTDEDPTPGSRCFIPATIKDNDNNDAGYVAQLNRLPDDQRKAFRDGDWNVYAGQRFKDFRTNIHVIDPEKLPIPIGGIPRAMGIDYGLDAPFCALWGAKLADDLVVVYRELYRAELTPTEQAELIRSVEAPGERDIGRPVPAALDPSCWARSPDDPKPAARTSRTVGKVPDRPPPGSIAGRYLAAGVPVTRANNDRLAGVAEVAQRLRVRPDGFPRLLIYSTCRNLIRTLPELPRDPRNPEDVDTHAEDHAYDALRYLLFKIGRSAPGTDNRGGRTPPNPPGPPRRTRAPEERLRPVTAGIATQGF